MITNFFYKQDKSEVEVIASRIQHLIQRDFHAKFIFVHVELPSWSVQTKFKADNKLLRAEL